MTACFLQELRSEVSLILEPGGTIRAFLVSLLGAATLTAGVLFFRQHQKEAQAEGKGQVPAGEPTARYVSLERMREAGL